MKNDQILDYIDLMPGLPLTVTKIVELSNDANASPNDIVHVIKIDPVLTVKILKLINSAYFGLPQSITSLTRAVILLGINTLKNLVLSNSILSIMKINKNIHDFNIELFWEHSLGCAVGSKILAEKMGVEKKFHEEYFIAGLIHDIGKIVFVQSVPNDYQEVRYFSRLNKKSIISEEDSLLGISHPKVGAMVSKKWNFPESLNSTINEHHEPTLDGKDIRLKLAVHIANVFCSIKGIGFEETQSYGFVSDKIWDIIGLSQFECYQAFDSIHKHIDDAREFLRLRN